MVEWYSGLSILEQIYFWLAIVATLFLIVQIVLMCFSSFGPDIDIDGDGIIDADPDSGVSVFTFKSITAFFAVGAWSGLLVCALVASDLQWVSVIVALLAGAIAMTAVALIIKAMLKLQCDGALQTDKLVGQKATVYVSVPPKRSGKGKITLTAQGKFVELDAVTDSDEKLTVDEQVEIIATENDCMVIKRA
jgi:hypothetical protein